MCDVIRSPASPAIDHQYLADKSLDTAMARSDRQTQNILPDRHLFRYGLKAFNQIQTMPVFETDI